MEQNPHFLSIFTAIAVLWVGGGGYLMFRHAEFLARVNARLGLKWMYTPKCITLIKKLGILEMVLAALSVGVFLTMVALGQSQF